MAFRFRRTLKLAPGVRLNVGKRGFSTSFGRRGASLTMGGARGLTGTIGMPGSGLSYTSNLSATSRVPRRASATIVTSPPTSPRPRTHRVSEGKQRAKLMTTVFGLTFLVMVPWLGMLILLVALLVPSRRKVLQRDLDERLEAMRRELDDPVTLTMVDRALEKQKELDVHDDELGAFGDRLHGMRAALMYQESVIQNGNQFPHLSEHLDNVRPDGACYFAGLCVYDKRGDDDPPGTLYLSDKRALFRSATRATPISWAKVIHVGRDERTLHIQREDRQSPTAFVFDDLGDAMIAELIAKNIRHNTLAAM